MKKRYIFLVSIIAIVSWFAFRALHAPKQTEEVVEIDSNPIVARNDNIPTTLKINPKKKESSVTTEVTKGVRVHETPDESFEAFDKLEKNWLSLAQNIIGTNHFARYIEMRDRNEKEKMQAYKEFHDYLRLKHGDNFSYNISEDQSVREKKINERYLNELLKLIGKDKFQEYTSAKDQYNEKIRRENKESIVIEF